MNKLQMVANQYINQLKALNPKYDVRYTLNKDEPIKFENSENVRLSFATIADTHVISNPVSFENLSNIFEDCKNSKENWDALLMAGDVAEYGRLKEYEGFFSVFDKKDPFSKIILTVGNHDVRFMFQRNSKIITDKNNEYTGENSQKVYFSTNIKGYTFIVISTEKAVFEKAYISDTQLDWLDKELQKATKDGKPAFVMCHQALAYTHGLPEAWKSGDMGAQSEKVKAVFKKHKNVFFLNGHLHAGIYEKTHSTVDEKNNVQSISIPSYRKLNNFGIRQCGTGYYCTVYDDKVVFKARDFLRGKNVNSEFDTLTFKLV